MVGPLFIMEKKYMFKFCFILVLFSLFLWQTIAATLKYLERKTITSTYNTDEGTILFPSITVCKKYSVVLYESDIRNMSMKIEKKIWNLYKNTWKKDEVFYFFSHPTMFNLSFPCTTMKGTGTSSGKPCSFPFLNWNGILENKCPSWGCITR